MREGQKDTMEMEKGLRVVGTPTLPLCAQYPRCAGVMGLGMVLWWVKPPVLGCFTGSVNQTLLCNNQNMPEGLLDLTTCARNPGHQSSLSLDSTLLPWPPSQDTGLCAHKLEEPSFSPQMPSQWIWNPYCLDFDFSLCPSPCHMRPKCYAFCTLRNSEL